MRVLLRRVVTLPAVPEAGPAMRERLPALAAWDRQRDLAQRVHRAMRERFGLDSLAAHPFARLSAALLADERAYGRAEQLCRDAEALFNALDPLLDSTASLTGHDTSLEQARALAADSQWLLDTGLAAHLDLLEPSSPAQAALREIRADLDTRAQALADARAATSNWQDKLSPGDTESALALARRLEPSIARWLQPAWWRLRGELKRRYDFGKHAIHPGYGKVLEALSAEHAARSASRMETRLESGRSPRRMAQSNLR